ncbi:MAG: L-cystine ABC transporter, ATP-binding protein TcyC, partial [uncultured Nocardioides sp.]
EHHSPAVRHRPAQVLRRPRGAARHRLHRRSGHRHGPARPLGVGQDDRAALAEHPRGPRRRHRAHRRRRGRLLPAPWAARRRARVLPPALPERDGVPVPQPLPPPHGAGEPHRGARPRPGPPGGGGGRRGPGPAGAGRPRQPRRRLPRPAVGGPAAAGGHRPRAGAAASPDALRRAHVLAGPRARRRGPRGDEGPRRRGLDHGRGLPRDPLRTAGGRPGAVPRQRRHRRAGARRPGHRRPARAAHPAVPAPDSRPDL